MVDGAVVCLATALVWASSIQMCLESPSSLWPDTPAGVVRIALPLLLSADRGDSRGVVQNMTGRRRFWRFSSTGPKLTPVTEEE